MDEIRVKLVNIKPMDDTQITKPTDCIDFMKRMIGDMRSVRDRINEDAKIAPQRQAELHHKHLRNVLIFVLIIAGGIGAAFAGLLLTGSLNAYLQPLDLTLTADQVNIEYGSSFSPMEYVQSYTQDSAVELILPDPLDTNALGKKELLYKLKNSKKVITKELEVNIIDDKIPKLILKQNEVKLTRTADDFHDPSHRSWSQQHLQRPE